MSDSLKMRWIDATCVSTKMIDFVALRYWTNAPLVGDTMRDTAIASSPTKTAVAGAIFRAAPEPTRLGFINL